jgi:acetyl esterase/lipase
MVALFSAATVASLGGCAHSPQDDSARSVQPATAVGFDPAHISRLFLPEGDFTAGAPLIVLVPGGGWTSADPAGLTGLAMLLAQRGAAVVTVTYRTASEGAYFPATAQDIACGLADAVARTQSADLDTGEVVVVGHSAGAQLSAVVALTPEAFASGCADPPVAPDRFVGLAGPYDVTRLGGLTSDIFGPDGQDPARWVAANPVSLATERPQLPVLLIHGADDTVVPAIFTEQFATALRAGGHPVVTRYPEGADHESVYSAEVAGPLIGDWLGLDD